MGSCTEGIDTDIDVTVDVDIDSCFWQSEGGFKVSQVLYMG